MGNLTAVGKMRIDKAAPSERMADRSEQALRMPEISTHAEELTMCGLFLVRRAQFEPFAAVCLSVRVLLLPLL